MSHSHLARPLMALGLGLAVLAIAPTANAQDVVAGEKVFAQCKACHTIHAGGPHRVGPNLNGVFGRLSGTAPGFKYSDAMAKAGVVWTEDTVAEYLRDPKGYIKGNRMAFAGVRKIDDMVNLVAYLKQASR